MSVGIVYGDHYRSICCVTPKFGDRYAMIMDLINAYGIISELLRIPPLEWVSNDQVYKELSFFHSMEYIEALKKLQEISTNGTDTNTDLDNEDFFDNFGLNYDCPGFRGVFDYAVTVIKGSLAAAMALVNRHCQVAINWAGGWHHAKRDTASGFCYLNDIVLAIHRLLSGCGDVGGGSLSNFSTNNNTNETNRLLYLDFDLHHGDGVEEAFWYSPRVVTFSVHHASDGFFPGTGTWIATEDGNNFAFPNGAGRGRFSAFNLPLPEGVDDKQWSEAVGPMLDMLYTLIQPVYIVVQCGADGLATDPHHMFRLSNLHPKSDLDSQGLDYPINEMSGYLFAMKKVLSWNIPTLILGGGGYNFADSARLWTKITALVVEEIKNKSLKLPSEIPEHSYFARYGPDFELDMTSLSYNSTIRDNIKYCEHIKNNHLRLLKQACNYGDLNTIFYDYNVLSEYLNI